MAKVVISKKQIIKIDEFMRNYIGKEYDYNGKITHRNMELFLSDKHISIPKRVDFNTVTNESMLMGEYIAVKDESGKVLIYMNPLKNSLENLFRELHTKENEKRTKKARAEILKSLGYEEAINGVKEKELEEDYRLEHINRQKQLILYKNNIKRKKHY